MALPPTAAGRPFSIQIPALIGFLSLVAIAAASGIFFEPGAWYAALVKPAFTPPAYVFPPVWTALYVAMAFSAWLVWRRWGWHGARLALSLFFAQLALNALWSWLFFGLHRPGLALLDLVLLWVLLLATLLAFGARHRGAALLLVPYFVWVSYAGVLNAAIWRLN